LLSNFSIKYAIRRVQVNQGSWKLNGSHQLLVYADDANILGGSIHTKKNTDALVVACKETGLEVNANTLSICKYLGTTSTNQSSIQEELKVEVKGSRNRPGVAQRVPRGLGYQITMTFGT
jgi:hypothetical protein